VNDTLYKLNLLTGIAAAAVAAGTSEANVVASGISAIADNVAATDITDATKCLERYDITSYATDPQHEAKVAAILTAMPLDIDSAEEIDTYVQSIAPSSPLTGAMVFIAAQTYAIDIRLMLALMQQDSQFGTQGVAIATLNPGNVGNTGTDTRTYSSWAEGVAAVAEWLSRHHKVVIAVEETKKEIINYDTVATSTLPTVIETVPETTTTSTASDRQTIASTTPQTNPVTSTLENIVNDILSPTSTESVATTTAETVIEPIVDSLASTTQDAIPLVIDTATSTQ
jgi:hypothetical protein